MQVSGQASSPWFSAPCAAVKFLEITFFVLYQENKSFESKVKFTQANNCCKWVVKAAKLANANETERFITSQKPGSQDFLPIANSVLNKDRSAILPLFNDPDMLSFASDQAKLFTENFSKNSNLDDPVISSPAFPSRTI